MAKNSKFSLQQGRASTAAVLGFAWDADAFRTDDAMKATGLTRSTTINALDELINLGLIRELSNTRADNSYRFGRPARRFEFRADAGILLGIDAGRSSLTITAADLRGEPIARSQYSLEPLDALPQRRRLTLMSGITQVLEELSLTVDDVVAVTVGVPAPVDPLGHSPAHPEGFWESMNPGFQTYLGEVFPIVNVENDASLAARAEALHGSMTDCPNFVSLLAGRRLGSGVMLDGRIVNGAHGGVGELEVFNLVKGLEHQSGLVDLIDRWVREGLASGAIPASHPLAKIPIDELSAELELPHLRLDDRAMRPIVERVGEFLARSCEVFSYLYDPEYVVVCGQIASAITDAIEHAQSLLDVRAYLPPPQLVASTLGNDIVSLGAVASARFAAQTGVLALRSERSELILRNG
ncbi:MAG: ROK family protein [Ancrocorticia sp.]